MKRLLCCLLTVLILLSPLAAVPAANAANDPIRVTGYKIVDAGDSKFYLSFILDRSIGEARHFQTMEKKWEDGLPEDAWDFDALLVDAGKSCVLINDISVGEYLDALGGQWSLGLFFEKDKKVANEQHFTFNLNSVPGIGNGEWKTKDYTIEVTDGMISREYWKFEPFKAMWNHKTQKMTIYRENDNGLTLDEVNAGGKPTTTSPSSKPTSKPATTTTAPTTGGSRTDPPTTMHGSSTTETTDPSGTIATGDTTADTDMTAPTAPSEPEEIIPTLGSFDITADSKDIAIDFPNKVVTLAKSMTVKEFLGHLSAVSGYQLGVYNGSDPVAEDQDIVSGYKFKVRVDDKLIGSFLLKAPAASNTGLVILIVCISAGVLLIAGGVLLYIFVIRKKLSARKESGPQS